VAGGALLSCAGSLTLAGVRGPLLVAVACLGWAIDNNLTQRVSAGDPVEVAGLKGLVAGAVNLTLGLLADGRIPGGARLAGALAVGLMGYGVSLVLYVRAMRDLGTARTGAYFSLAPFIGAALSIVLWHESATPLFLVAAALMGFGLWLHLTEHHEHWHNHEPLEHTHAHVHDEHHQHAHGAEDLPEEPHTHRHRHRPIRHAHPHYPDIHHRHSHPG